MIALLNGNKTRFFGNTEHVLLFRLQENAASNVPYLAGFQLLSPLPAGGN
jgi:hypothetical protein